MEDFSEPLFSCQKTPGLFCFLTVFACIGGPCCVQGKVVAEFTQRGFVYHCALPCCCLCLGASLNRQTLRQKLGMEPDFVRDCVLHLFCNTCAVNQEFLESVHHRTQGTLNLLPIGMKGKKGKHSFTPEAPIELIN
jgi:Cys-rich protein (TIGR01571 family)